jgi:N-acetylated-alpha-linked acidic dipeptidase
VTELEALAKGRPGAPVDLGPVRTAVDALGRAARGFEEAYQRVERSPSTVMSSASSLRALNKLLFQSERALGDASGLPRREWFKHQIYAPGFYTGYGVKTMPQIREGLEGNRADEAREGVRKVAGAVDALARQVDQAAAVLRKTLP